MEKRLKEITYKTCETTGDPFKFLDRMFEKYGDVVGYKSGYGNIVLFNHPDGVKAVIKDKHLIRTPLLQLVLGYGLLTSDGPYWHNQRRIAQPAFHAHCLAGFAQIIINATEQRIGQWEARGQTNGPLDISQEMRLLTMQIITKSLFSVDLDFQEVEDWDAILHTLIVDANPFLLGQFNVASNIKKTRNAEFHESLNKMEQKIYAFITKRRNQKDPPRDLLSALLNGTVKETGEPLTDQQIRNEVITMLIAGHETTAIAITWCFDEINKHPEIKDELMHETDTLLKGKPPSHGQLSQLKKQRQVIDEVLRLHSPLWFISRLAEKETSIAGYRIPEKTIVIFSSYITHRHPEFWDEPNTFKPSRFSMGSINEKHPNAYFPFGGGRHICIGNDFAIMEMQLILSIIFQHYKIRPVDGSFGDASPGTTLRMKRNLLISLTKR